MNKAEELFDISLKFNNNKAEAEVIKIINRVIELATEAANNGRYEVVINPRTAGTEMLWMPSNFQKTIRALFEQEIKDMGFKFIYTLEDYITDESYTISFKKE